jgi:dTDP-4-amino-4,6-dideoxygalactose transaminase
VEEQGVGITDRVPAARDLFPGPHSDGLPDSAAAPIPFLDLPAQHRALHEEILEAWSELLLNATFIGGRPVEEFEAKLAAYVGVEHAVGVGNGTDAIMLALLALGLEPGDEVITAANTFIATIEAIVHAGGKPVLVDVDPLTATIDPARIEAAITEQTRFIVPVHIYGQSAEMDQIMAIAAHHDLIVVEDNAQAIGARYHGRRTGSIGHAAAISFYPGKNLGGAGDGGAVTTDDAAVAGQIRVLANHGQSGKHEHTAIGYNSRLDALQAAALSIKLSHLDGWNERRRQIAAQYGELLGATTLSLPTIASGNDHVFHLYVIRHPEREALARGLTEQRIGTGMHYPTPIHLMTPFLNLGAGPGSYPAAEDWAGQLLSLPMGPTMTDDDVSAAAAALDKALGELDVFQRHSA